MDEISPADEAAIVGEWIIKTINRLDEQVKKADTPTHIKEQINTVRWWLNNQL